MKYTRIVNIIFILLFFVSCQPQFKQVTNNASNKILSKKVILGVDNFLKKYVHLLKNKKVGLVTNPSGVTGELKATADALYEHPEINLVALFGPEHGIRGNQYAGDKITDEVDPKTGIMLYSLYGKTKKPTKSMMNQVDIIIFDIQDTGVRSYTYISTLSNVMQACAEFNVPIIVFDRPNPLNGIQVEGNILDSAFTSNVGKHEIPYLHGMTIGELALLFNTHFKINCDLTVIPMIGWDRNMFWNETGLIWIPTSTHLPEWHSAVYMAATGTFGELHTLSEGVGYTSPFQLVGAPWINSEILAENLNNLNLPGVYFRAIYYKPIYGRFKTEMCQGVQLHITSFDTFKPYVTGLHIMQTIMKLYPDHDLFANKKRIKMFNQVVGTDKIMNNLKAGISVFEMEKAWQPELNEFIKIRKKYLLY